MNSFYNLSNIKSEIKYSIRLAIPLVASEVIYGLNNFIATVLISGLGKTELAANALVWGIYIAIILFFIGIFCSVGIMVAHSYGAKDTDSISICFKQGLILAAICTIPMMAALWLAPLILVWTKQDPAVIDCARPYFHSLSLTMLCLNVWIIIQQFLTGINKVKPVVLMSIIAVPVEIFFYYVFLYGKFGFPKAGLAGIGYGLAASNYTVITVFICYLYFSKEFKPYNLFTKWWVLNRKFLLEMLRIGLPLGFTYCSELIFFAIIAILMGTLGVNVLAAYQISYQYLLIGLVVLFGLGQAVTIRVGNEVGRLDRNSAKLAAYVNLGIALLIISFFSLFYLLFPETAVRLDINPNIENFKIVAKEAIKFFPIVAVMLLTESIRIIYVNALRGLKDSNFQMLISILGFWFIAFPSVYLLGFKLGLGGVGIWCGVVIGLAITGVMMMLRFNRLVNRVDLVSLVTKK